MYPKDLIDCEDVGDAVREDRELRPAAAYRVLYGANGLDFQPLLLADPVPLGRQVLEAAGVRRLDNWALIAILAAGDMEDVRLHEPFDLRGRGVERFVGFETDRLLRARLGDNQLLWGRPMITARELRELAGLSDGEAVYLDVPGGTDRLIAPGDSVDLSQPGVERFVIGRAPVDDRIEIAVVYNGLQQAIRVHPADTAAAAVAAVSPLFGSPGGDLVLVNEHGQELADHASLRDQGVQAHARLLLRPRTVRGG